MAEYVEIIGSPGVGKTTVYNLIRQGWNADSHWICEDHCYPQKNVIVSRAPYKRHVRTYARYVLSRLRGEPGYSVGKVPDKSGHAEAVERFVHENGELVDLFWQAIVERKRERNGLDRRYHLARHVFGIFERLQRVLDHSSSWPAVMDEAILHNIGLFLNSNDGHVSKVKQMANLVDTGPMPVAVIYLEADPEQIMKRLLDRGYRIGIHKGLEEEALSEMVWSSIETKKRLLRVLSERKIRVHNVDANVNPATIALEVQKILGGACDTAVRA